MAKKEPEKTEHVKAHDRSAPGPSEAVVHVDAYDRADDALAKHEAAIHLDAGRCPMWADRIHSYVQGIIRADGKFFAAADDLVTVKHCMCGATVTLGPPS